MKLACNTWCYRNLSKEDAIARIGGFGFQGIELIAHAPCFHADVRFTPREKAAVKQLVANHGMTIVALSPSTDYLKFTEEERRAQIEHTNAITDLCVEMGAPISRIFSGGRVPEGRSWQECVDAVVATLKPCADYAESQGVQLAIESHGQFGCDLEALAAILDAVDSPASGITLDTSNFYSSGVDPLEAARRLVGRIYHTHLKDGSKTPEGYRGEAVGEGDLDFPAILALLKKQGYRGYYCVEYEGREDPDLGVRKSLEYLRTLRSES